ncbi:MAG: hypothetical protein VW625_01210 [Perlucidibaca sp.]
MTQRSTDISREELWEFPMDYPLTVMGEARYPIAISQAGMEKQSAGAFFRFIQSEIALDVFREYGFGIATMPEFNE